MPTTKPKLDPFKNFTPQEYACKCVRAFCSSYKMQPKDIAEDLAFKVQRLRDLVGGPLVFNSAGRCPDHHLDVTQTNARQATPKSGHVFILNHRTVRAVDIREPKEKSLIPLFRLAYEAGFRRIGYYRKNNFIHCDVLPGELYWDLDESGKYRYFKDYKSLPWLQNVQLA